MGLVGMGEGWLIRSPGGLTRDSVGKYLLDMTLLRVRGN